jgi:hypothetical protein
METSAMVWSAFLLPGFSLGDGMFVLPSGYTITFPCGAWTSSAESPTLPRTSDASLRSACTSGARRSGGAPAGSLPRMTRLWKITRNRPQSIV